MKILLEISIYQYARMYLMFKERSLILNVTDCGTIFKLQHKK